MRVEQLMTRNVHACTPDDPLNIPAGIMWDHDSGCVPVVVPEDGACRVVGMITDRDICMAAYTQVRPLQDITVSNAMSKEVCSCGPSDPIELALKIMRRNQLHRLPVIDSHGHLAGIFSLADVARENAHERIRAIKEAGEEEIGETIVAICGPRSPRDLVRAA